MYRIWPDGGRGRHRRGRVRKRTVLLGRVRRVRVRRGGRATEVRGVDDRAALASTAGEVEVFFPHLCHMSDHRQRHVMARADRKRTSKAPPGRITRVISYRGRNPFMMLYGKGIGNVAHLEERVPLMEGKLGY